MRGPTRTRPFCGETWGFPIPQRRQASCLRRAAFLRSFVITAHFLVVVLSRASQVGQVALRQATEIRARSIAPQTLGQFPADREVAQVAEEPRRRPPTHQRARRRSTDARPRKRSH
eukprot:scaffold266_cov248-Pinguiococcus_pyrenoidosus.AAC.2